MRLTVKIANTREGNFRAWCPALPGCMVWGLSEDEVRQKISKAVDGYLASLDIALPRELSRMSEIA